MKKLFFVLLLLCSPACGQVVIPEGADLKGSIESALSAGETEIQLTAGARYVVTEPIVLNADTFSIVGNGARIVRAFETEVKFANGQSGVWGKAAVFSVVARRGKISDIEFDFFRQSVWRSYARMIDFDVEAWWVGSGRLSYDGPLSRYCELFELTGCKFIDSQGKHKKNSELDPADEGRGRRDQWGIVSNSATGIGSLLVTGNFFNAQDAELTGGSWGASNYLFEGNVCRGGFTTGGQIGTLSRYFGEETRRIDSMIFRNNTIFAGYRYGISCGSDSNKIANIDIGSIVFEGNRVIVSPDFISPEDGKLEKYSRLGTIKLHDFKGTVVIRDNTYDLRQLDPALRIFPRDFVVTNFAKGSDVGFGQGLVLYSPSTLLKPEGAQFRFFDNIRRDHFTTVIQTGEFAR